MHAEAARERDIARAMLNQVIADNFDGVVVIGDDGRILEASRPAQDILNRPLRGRRIDALPEALAASVAAALAAPGRSAPTSARRKRPGATAPRAISNMSSRFRKCPRRPTAASPASPSETSPNAAPISRGSTISPATTRSPAPSRAASC